MPFLHGVGIVLHQPVGERRDRAALARHFRRDALRHLREDAVVDQRVDLGLAHHVDEAGGDDEPAHVHCVLRRRGAEKTDCSDAVSADRDVAAVARVAAAVDDPAALQDHVVRPVGAMRRRSPPAAGEQ